ncbi:Gfo/Idh/MocA family protein [Sphingobacterium spiritivorum]|uniref:Gfo/Idh/MocA family protein n=1 Tax=Sphingobacterium spiritivorum TaxID=258 RepID=UPI003DA49866
MNEMNQDRRTFIRQSAVVAASLAAIPHLGYATSAKKIKVGLIGCGGRGTGAASQALAADPQVEITALADIFPDQLEHALTTLREIDAARVHVDDKNKFVGFDAYKKLINSGVDVVLLCSPPNFRPDHLEEAVKAGKHIFCEKPVAVDIPGIHRVSKAVELAKQKKLNIVCGFCFRYSTPNREIIKQVRAGSIGDVKGLSTFRYGGELTFKDRQPSWSDLEFQLRNWLFYTRYSGDMLVEQAIHSVDFMSWVMNDELPKLVTGTGGRQAKPWDKFGNVYDHYAVEYAYAGGLKSYHFSRQQNGTTSRNSVDVMGTQGQVDVKLMSSYEVLGEHPWKFTGRLNNMYQTQHDELFAAIRNGQVINDGDSMTKSTLLGIWGRTAAYTGKAITYDEIMNSQVVLGPHSDEFDWNMKVDQLPIPRPGLTTFG